MLGLRIKVCILISWKQEVPLALYSFQECLVFTICIDGHQCHCGDLCQQTEGRIRHDCQVHSKQKEYHGRLAKLPGSGDWDQIVPSFFYV